MPELGSTNRTAREVFKSEKGDQHEELPSPCPPIRLHRTFCDKEHLEDMALRKQGEDVGVTHSEDDAQGDIITHAGKSLHDSGHRRLSTITESVARTKSSKTRWAARVMRLTEIRWTRTITD